jgi:hypothetical protein
VESSPKRALSFSIEKPSFEQNVQEDQSIPTTASKSANSLAWLGTPVALPSDQTTNPNKGERKMRTDEQTIRENEIVLQYMDLASVKEWAKATFRKESITEAVVYASTATVLGMVLFSLYRAMETRTIVGF